jgi:transcriptional regulator with XRE-family HTH domain
LSPRPGSEPQHAVLADIVRQVRLDAGRTQADLARRLDRPQSYVSKVESGERRLDVVELRDWCAACGQSLAVIAMRFEDMLRDFGTGTES